MKPHHAQFANIHTPDGDLPLTCGVLFGGRGRNSNRVRPLDDPITTAPVARRGRRISLPL